MQEANMTNWSKKIAVATVAALAATSPAQVEAGNIKRNGISYIGSQRTRPDRRNPVGACATVSVYDRYRRSIDKDVANAEENCAINSFNTRYVHQGDSDHYHYHPEPNGRTPLVQSHYHVTTNREKAKCFATELSKKQNFPDKSRKKLLSQIDRSCEPKRKTLYVDRFGQAHKSPAQTLYVDKFGQAHKAPAQTLYVDKFGQAYKSPAHTLFMDTNGQAHRSL